MSKLNPTSSLKALFPLPIDCGFGVKVYPLSLGHYALLEKIDSFLIDGNHIPDELEVIRTFYICTHSAKEIIQNFERLDELSFEWADTIPPSINSNIANAIHKQIEIMTKVVPITDSKKKEVKTVVGMDS